MPSSPPPTTESAPLRLRQAVGRFAPLIALTLVISSGYWFWTRLPSAPTATQQPTAQAPATNPASVAVSTRAPRRPATRPPAQSALLVPALTGLTTAEARQRLTEDNLRLGRREWKLSDQARGTILETSPREGTAVTPQTRIELTLSAGPLQAIPVVSTTLTTTASGPTFSPDHLDAEPGSLLVISNDTSTDCTVTGNTPPLDTSNSVIPAGQKANYYLFVVSTYRLDCNPGPHSLTVQISE